jgi:hypothetical protein
MLLSQRQFPPAMAKASLPEIVERERALFGLIADERRAFVATRILEEHPQQPAHLREKMIHEFPDLVDILGWPRQETTAANNEFRIMCKRSLSTLGVADSIVTLVEAGFTSVPGRQWYATPFLESIRDQVDFSLEMGNRFNMSMLQVLGYLAGHNAKSAYSRAKMLMEVVDVFERSGTFALPKLPSYHSDKHNSLINHLSALEALGYIAIERMVGNEFSWYYWKSGEVPNETLVRSAKLNPQGKSLAIARAIYEGTTGPGGRTMSSAQLSEAIECGEKWVRVVANKLVKAGYAGVRDLGGHFVSATAAGRMFEGSFLSPLFNSLSGNSIDLAYINGIAAAFRSHESEGLQNAMRRNREVSWYLNLPGNP